MRMQACQIPTALGYCPHCIEEKMKVDMHVFKPMKVDKVWGHELWIHNGPDYCGKLLHVNYGASSSLHYHVKKSETFHIIRGRIRLEMEGSHTDQLRPGDTVEVLPGVAHRFTGLSITPAIIMEVSTEHFDDDSVRLEVSTDGKE